MRVWQQKQGALEERGILGPGRPPFWASIARGALRMALKRATEAGVSEPREARPPDPLDQASWATACRTDPEAPFLPLTRRWARQGQGLEGHVLCTQPCPGMACPATEAWRLQMTSPQRKRTTQLLCWPQAASDPQCPQPRRAGAGHLLGTPACPQPPGVFGSPMGLLTPRPPYLGWPELVPQALTSEGYLGLQRQ